MKIFFLFFNWRSAGRRQERGLGRTASAPAQSDALHADPRKRPQEHTVSANTFTFFASNVNLLSSQGKNEESLLIFIVFLGMKKNNASIIIAHS